MSNMRTMMVTKVDTSLSGGVFLKQDDAAVIPDLTEALMIMSKCHGIMVWNVGGCEEAFVAGEERVHHMNHALCLHEVWVGRSRQMGAA